MKYHDSMDKAQQKMTQVCIFLERHNISPMPVNYHVVYSYISKSHAELHQAMETLLASDKPIDNYVLEELFNIHLAEQDNSQKTLLKGVDKTLNVVDNSIQTSSQSVSNYISTLDESLVEIDDADTTQAKQIISALIDASYELKLSQQQLQEALLCAKSESKKTKLALEKLEQQRHIDPLTGLYKSSMMTEKAEKWIKQSRKICAIAIDIDDFRGFNDKYGHLIGDVVLNKVAKKVRSYVQESGLPIRTRGEEFVILLPDVEIHTAQEIANKMRSGVEKLKFISSRSGKRLPSLTISLGVSELGQEKNLQRLTSQAFNAIKKAKSDGKNTVVCLS